MENRVQQTDRLGRSDHRISGGGDAFTAVKIGFGIQLHKFEITRITLQESLGLFRPKAWNILVLMPAP